MKTDSDGCIVVSAERLREMAEADEDTACSYQEWRDAGYCVVRGSKSRLRDATGVPQFTLDQVTKVRCYKKEFL